MSLAQKIRRQETPFYARLYRIASRVRRASVPTIGPLHRLLYREWAARTAAWHEFWRVVYYEPMFRSRCASVGPGFRMMYAGNGTTRICGPLRIHLGRNVTLFDNTALYGVQSYANPELHVGDDTYVGPNVRILVAREVRIGRHCLVASRLVTDNPGHPVDDVMARLRPGGGLPEPASVRPVSIGDFCFLPIDTVVYPGVRVGDGVVAAVGSHLTHDVPPFCLVAGNPARIVRRLPIPAELLPLVGPERFASWQGSLAAGAAL